MNPRVLELLKDPKSIQSEDLHLLKEEINSFPYIQNIRALHLYGVHLYDKENYQKELSTTAAYTTDKKILYQLINGKIQQKPKPEVIVEEKKTERPKNTFNYTYKSSSFPLKREEKEAITENISIPVQQVEKPVDVKAEQIPNEEVSVKNKYEEAARLIQKPKTEAKDVFVNGERNRILFEGEENFLSDENTEKIDLESTLESGVIVTQKAEIKDAANEEINDSESVINIPDEVENAKEDFTPETIIEEENISSKEEKEEINDEEELSFHETESLETRVNIPSNEINDEKIEENVAEETEKSIAEFTPETIINEEKISSEKVEEIINDESELSFHETQSFLPEVNSLSLHGMQAFLPGTKIQTNNAEKAEKEGAQPTINKHEEEMRRLIEEVEKKMKESKKDSEEKKNEEPEVSSHHISFAETQSFDVKPVEESNEEKAETVKSVETKSENIEEVQKPKEEIVKEEPVKIQEEASSWKPMSFESHVPDSLLKKTQENPQPKIETAKEEAPKQEEILPGIKELPELVKDKSQEFGKATGDLQKDPEAPVMNVSFFNSDTIASWKVDMQKEEVDEEKAEIPQEITPEAPVDSNVPGFINTWQSWLKIDRTPEVEEKDKTEIKNKVIETFIETNPKISQLKDEVNFVVKEKNVDISHLMTETLATLYFEQKLYTKAIKAFEVLAKKHPEKKEYFEAKIQEIKDNRTKN